MLATVTVEGDPPELGCPGEPAGVESPNIDSEEPAEPPVAVLAPGAHVPPAAAPVCCPKNAYPEPPFEPASVLLSACAVVRSFAALIVEGKAPVGLPPLPPFPAEPPRDPSPAPPPPAETTRTQVVPADTAPTQRWVVELHCPPLATMHTAVAPPPDPELV